MKKLKFLILLFIFNCTLFIVNSQSVYFNKRIDVTGSGEVCRGVALAKGGYLVAGGTGDGIREIYLSYIDYLGNLKWTQYYYNSSYLYYFGLSGSLFPTKDNYYAICGVRIEPGQPLPGPAYAILIKVDSLGNKIWEKDYPTINNFFNSGNTTKDSGYILTGYGPTTGTTNFGYLLLKADNMGNQQWYKTYTDHNPNRNYAGYSVMQTPDKGYCIGGGGGEIDLPYYNGIVEVIKTDSLGNQQWKKTYGNPLYANWGTMVSLSADSCIIASYSVSYSNMPEDNRQIYVAKIGLNGIEKWNKKIGLATLGNGSTWVQTIDDGSLIVSGFHLVRDTINKSIGWLFKLNSNGDSLWYREYAVIQGPNESNQLWQVTPTPDKGFAGAGSLFPEESGGTQDIWVFKTDSLGCLVYNCTGLVVTEFNPNAGAQLLVYPNPFKEAFAINYSIPKESKKGVFELRDVMGGLVYSTTLSNNVRQLQVVASSLKTGVYLATFIVDGVMVSSQKIIKE